jgi:1-acyl-sn-glycerol-3-phosphate acyltransferase
LLSLFGGSLLARGDMADWPVIGVLARRAGTLFVDRSDPASGAAAVQRIRERLRSGVTVGVFPEGTTFPGDDVREFQGGAFIAIARESGDVVPVGIAYERPDAVYGDEPVMDHMKRLVRAPSIRVGVAVGSPVEAPRQIRSLAVRLRDDVQSLVHKARALAGGVP